jgi:hypothetical protein
VYKGFGAEKWEKETTWKPRRRWKDNIMMDLKEVGCVGVDWTEPNCLGIWTIDGHMCMKN